MAAREVPDVPGSAGDPPEASIDVPEWQWQPPTRGEIQERPLLPGEIYIGRGTPLHGRSKWCNPFSIKKAGSRDRAIDMFAEHLDKSKTLLMEITELRGCKLLCHCKAEWRCHADVIISVAAREAGRVPPIRRMTLAIKLLYLFSGVPGRPDSLADLARNWGRKLGIRVVVDELDIESGTDLADEDIWRGVTRSITSRQVDGILASPPCSTFGCRRLGDGGPSPLRESDGPELYGKTVLRPEDKKKVRLGTLLAVRAAEAASLATERGIPWLNEQPHEQPGRPHMYRLNEWARVLEHPEVKRETVDQCLFGSVFKKCTDFVGTVPLRLPRGRCNHQVKQWRLPDGGRAIAAHPPLQGKTLAVPWTRQGGRQHGFRCSEWLTRGSAAYPNQLNSWLARRLLLRSLDVKLGRIKSEGTCRKEDSSAHKLETFGKSLAEAHGDMAASGPQARRLVVVRDDKKVIFKTPLKYMRHAEDESQLLGGMRDPQKAVAMIPAIRSAGEALRQAVAELLRERPDIQENAIRSFGTDTKQVQLPEDHIALVRAKMYKLWDIDPKEDEAAAHTPLRPVLLDAWRRAAHDPDDAVLDWLRHGAPAGLSKLPESRGVFPTEEGSELAPPEWLASETDEDFVNYEGVEEDDDVFLELKGLVDSGKLLALDSMDEVRRLVGDKITLSKVGCIKKESHGLIKKRIIVDAKQSGISGSTAKCERIVLPRLSDPVFQALHQMRVAKPGEDTEMAVLDFKDAFFLMPLHESERRYFVLRYRGKFLVFLVTAQGAPLSPLTWGRLAALVGRLTQGMFDALSLMLSIYVDDPNFVITGVRFFRDGALATIALVWNAVGFPLAFRKAARGKVVDWIGGTFTVARDRVSLRVKESILSDLKEQVQQALKVNVCSRKAIRSLAGRACHVASVVWPLRPFLQQLWGAVSSPPSLARGPTGIWTSQVRQSLEWLLAFLDGTRGTLVREYTVMDVFNAAPRIAITLDASPWGLGAVLEMAGSPVAWYGVALQPEDVAIFKLEIGDPRGQQAWESLNALVALRHWSHCWRGQRVQLAVRGDSVTMLTLIMSFRPATKSGPLGLISREVALDVADSEYGPDIKHFEHIPGLANVTTDVLSRRFAPDAEEWRVPAVLAGVPETHPPRRHRSYYRTLAHVPAKPSGEDRAACAFQDPAMPEVWQ